MRCQHYYSQIKMIVSLLININFLRYKTIRNGKSKFHNGYKMEKLLNNSKKKSRKNMLFSLLVNKYSRLILN